MRKRIDWYTTIRAMERLAARKHSSSYQPPYPSAMLPKPIRRNRSKKPKRQDTRKEKEAHHYNRIITL